MISSNSQFPSDSVRLTPRQKHAVPLILGALKRRGRVQVGQDHEADLVRMEVLSFSGMRDEGFEREVNRLREVVISEALDRLKTAVTGAVEGLTTLVDAEESNIRLRACGNVLDYFMKARELEDMERRLIALERAILKNERQIS